MELNHKKWNEGHQKLNQAFAAGNREKAIDLFLKQHAMVHSSKIARSGLWSFEDEALEDLTDGQIRMIPMNGEHSIAWILLHIARIEDITMNMLVADAKQLFIQDGWAKKLKINVVHSANKMDDESVAKLSKKIDVTALKAYRIAVGRQTRKIVKKLQAEDFKKKVGPARIQQVMNEKAVAKEAVEIINYWSTRTIAGLLLMPATRHNMLHLNEALRIRKRLPR